MTRILGALTIATALAAFGLSAAQTSTIVEILPMAAYSAVQRNIPATNVPSATSRIAIWAEKVNWTDPTATIQVNYEISLDSGTTWIPWGGARLVGGSLIVAPDARASAVFNGMGGSIVDQATGEMRYAGFRICIPEVGTADRRIRGTVLTNKTITTAISVELDPSTQGCS